MKKTLIFAALLCLATHSRAVQVDQATFNFYATMLPKVPAMVQEERIAVNYAFMDIFSLIHMGWV